MKKTVLISIALAVFISTQAKADQHQSLEGLILGAGGGALMGQAIGRNTQSTVIGTAVGSVIGYIIGSEMEKDSYSRRTTVSHGRTPVIQKQIHITRYEYNNPPVTPNRGNRINKRQRIYEPECKEAEILGTINGRAKKMTGTVCRTQNGWELVSEPTFYHDDYRKQSTWKQRRKIKKQYRKFHQEESWVRHKF